LNGINSGKKLGKHQLPVAMTGHKVVPTYQAHRRLPAPHSRQAVPSPDCYTAAAATAVEHTAQTQTVSAATNELVAVLDNQSTAEYFVLINYNFKK
jgi:hypothetical protein